MTIAIEIIGWTGAVVVLGAYLMLACKKLKSDSYLYHGLNVLGALLLAIYALCKDATASLFVNTVWIGIGVMAMVGLYRAVQPQEPGH